jgi:hypothetical protein
LKNSENFNLYFDKPEMVYFEDELIKDIKYLIKEPLITLEFEYDIKNVYHSKDIFKSSTSVDPLSNDHSVINKVQLSNKLNEQFEMMEKVFKIIDFIRKRLNFDENDLENLIDMTEKLKIRLTDQQLDFVIEKTKLDPNFKENFNRSLNERKNLHIDPLSFKAILKKLTKLYYKKGFMLKETSYDNCEFRERLNRQLKDWNWLILKYGVVEAKEIKKFFRNYNILTPDDINKVKRKVKAYGRNEVTRAVTQSCGPEIHINANIVDGVYLRHLIILLYDFYDEGNNNVYEGIKSSKLHPSQIRHLTLWDIRRMLRERNITTSDALKEFFDDYQIGTDIATQIENERRNFRNTKSKNFANIVANYIQGLAKKKGKFR